MSRRRQKKRIHKDELRRGSGGRLRKAAVALGIEHRRLRIVRGHTSRQKVVLVDGLDEAEVRAGLASASS